MVSVGERQRVDWVAPSIRTPKHDPKGSNLMPKRLLALALIVLPLAFAAAALAAPPTNEVTVVVDAVADDTEICADFGLPSSSSRTARSRPGPSTTAKGTSSRPSSATSTRDSLSTASANGKTLSTNYPLVFITRGDDADIRVGLRNAYHVPGAGVVLLDAGHLIFDANGDLVFEAGQHDLLNGSVDAFCGYFD